MERKLYRNTKDEVFMGVCSGLAEYFGEDVTLIRCIFVLTMLFTGVAIMFYALLALCVDEKPTGE